MACDCSKRVGPDEGNVITSLFYETIWPDGDIEGNDVAAYKKSLTENASDNQMKKEEFFYVCKNHYNNRLKVLTDLLKDHYKDKVMPAIKGSTGETPLHIALLYKNVEAAEMVIDALGKSVIMGKIIKQHHNGLTALHLAAVNGYRDIIKRMFILLDDDERLELLATQTTGDLFCNLKKVSGLPLTLALWAGQKEVFCDLIGYGAKLDDKDETTGNNIVHSLVEYYKTDAEKASEMLKYLLSSTEAVRWWCRVHGDKVNPVGRKARARMRCHLLKARNDDGYTPITLAAKIGSPEALGDLLSMDDVYRFPQMTYGNTGISLYELSEIDTMVAPNNQPNVSELILYLEDDDVLPAFKLAPIKTLLNLRWKQYFYWFIGWALVHLVYVVFLSYCAMHRPLNNNQNATGSYKVPLDQAYTTPTSRAFMFGACFTVVWSVLIMLGELRDMVQVIKIIMNRMRTTDSYKVPLAVIRKSNHLRFLLSLGHLFNIIWFIVHLTGNSNEDIILSISLICSWYSCLFFLLAYSTAAYTIEMFIRILFGDILRFLIMSLFIMVGFTLAMIVLFQEAPAGLTDELKPFGNAFVNFYFAMTGLGGLETYSEGRVPEFSTSIYVLYTILAYVLIMNMLIGAMSNTYNDGYAAKELLWLKSRGASVELLARRLPRCCALSHRALTSETATCEDGSKITVWYLEVDEKN